ncbi:CAPN8 isoform 4, partial [Pongo abelii]
ELCPSPQFIIGGATRTDICQGGLETRWMRIGLVGFISN